MGGRREADRGESRRPSAAGTRPAAWWRTSPTRTAPPAALHRLLRRFMVAGEEMRLNMDELTTPLHLRHGPCWGHAADEPPEHRGNGARARLRCHTTSTRRNRQRRAGEEVQKPTRSGIQKLRGLRQRGEHPHVQCDEGAVGHRARNLATPDRMLDGTAARVSAARISGRCSTTLDRLRKTGELADLKGPAHFTDGLG